MQNGTEGAVFGSGDWFATTRRRIEEVALDARASCRLNFTADTTHWHLCIGAGRLESFDREHVDAVDAELQWSVPDATAIASGAMRGDEAMRHTTVVAPAPRGHYIGPPAPLNLSCQPEFETLPRVPGATLNVQYVFRNGPFGDVNYGLSFVDGRGLNESFGLVADPTVLVDVSYRSMALVRAGEITILDALVDGRVEGPEGALALLAGLHEEPAFHAAELATGRHAIALAALGDLNAALARTSRV